MTKGEGSGVATRRGYLAALGAGAGVGIVATVGAMRLSQDRKASQEETVESEEVASVSFEIAETSVPHAVSIEVTDWGDADAVRVYCPSAVETVQTLDRDLDRVVIDGLGVTAGMLVESAHGDWRTTIAQRWIHGDPIHLEDEEPGLREGATWALEEMNETENDNDN